MFDEATVAQSLVPNNQSTETVADRIVRLQTLFAKTKEGGQSHAQIQAFGNFSNFSRTWESFSNWGNR